MGARSPRDSPASLPVPSSSFMHVEAGSAAHPESVALEGLGSRPSLKRHEDHVSPGGMGQHPKMGGLAGLQNIRRGTGEGEWLEWGGDEETQDSSLLPSCLEPPPSWRPF